MNDRETPAHDPLATLPPANTDESRVPPYTPADLGFVGLDPSTLARRQAAWRADLADAVYGPIPPPPDAITVDRRAIPEEGYSHLSLTLRAGRCTHRVDAALWLPAHTRGAVPLIVGLGFLGPAAVLFGDSFPLDPDARVESASDVGLADRRLAEHVRGLHAARWPLPLILGAGHGLLLSCYGSWVPDDPAHWQAHGAWPLLDLADDDDRPGTLSLWAWAFQRLVDVAADLPEVDIARIALAGHSRLGKAALWAAACDPRIAAVMANNSGCLGAALSCRNFGETPRHLAAAFPYWVTPRLAAAVSDGNPPAIDQHALLASIAPRRIYVASAAQDLWADPCGEYEGLRAAGPAWATAGAPQLAMPDWSVIAAPNKHWAGDRIGWHLRPGGHALTPWDWRRFLAFLS